MRNHTGTRLCQFILALFIGWAASAGANQPRLSRAEAPYNCIAFERESGPTGEGGDPNNDALQVNVFTGVYSDQPRANYVAQSSVPDPVEPKSPDGNYELYLKDGTLYLHNRVQGQETALEKPNGLYWLYWAADNHSFTYITGTPLVAVQRTMDGTIERTASLGVSAPQIEDFHVVNTSVDGAYLVFSTHVSLGAIVGKDNDVYTYTLWSVQDFKAVAAYQWLTNYYFNEVRPAPSSHRFAFWQYNSLIQRALIHIVSPENGLEYTFALPKLIFPKATGPSFADSPYLQWSPGGRYLGVTYTIQGQPERYLDVFDIQDGRTYPISNHNVFKQWIDWSKDGHTLHYYESHSQDDYYDEKAYDLMTGSSEVIFHDVIFPTATIGGNRVMIPWRDSHGLTYAVTDFEDNVRAIVAQGVTATSDSYTWSRDGKILAFPWTSTEGGKTLSHLTIYRDDIQQLYTLDEDFAELPRLLWLGESQSIALITKDVGKTTYSLDIFNTLTHERQRILDQAVQIGLSVPDQVGMFFVRWIDANGQTHAKIYDNAGKDLITFAASGDLGGDRFYSSPDGNRILLAASDPKGQTLELAALDGKFLKILGIELKDLQPSSWSPDGQLFAFISTRSGKHGLNIFDRNGNWIRTVMPFNPTNIGDPSSWTHC